MKSDITADNRNGNLHVLLKGKISSTTIHDLIPILCQSYRGEGNIFLNTEQCSSVSEEAPALLEKHIKLSALPEKKVYLIGELGFSLSTGFAKVIVRPPRKARCLGCRKKTSPPQSAILSRPA